MAQITIYLSDDLAEQLKQRARAAGLSVSAYLAELARHSLRPARWPDDFTALYGSCSLTEVDSLAAEDLPPW